MELFVQGVKEEASGSRPKQAQVRKKERKSSIEDKQRQTGRKHLSARPHNVTFQNNKDSEVVE